MNEQLQSEIEQMLHDRSPDVEVVLAERAGPGLVRVFIDHPQGVDTDLCERVSRDLGPLRERYALEVSSPGVERPLVRPDHYRRAVGRKVDVRTVEPIDGRRHFTALLVDADDAGIDLEQDDRRVRIDYAAIRRGRLVFESWGGRS
ncbi:MAG TPA: ribosome maturation factor RimP [Gaiellales bacterium]|jgi:ribosome maturation factor RimP